MQSLCPIHDLPVLHVCLKCEYQLICQKCKANEHDTHRRVELKQIFDLIYRETDEKILLKPIQANNQLQMCDQNFQRVSQLIGSITDEIHFAYNQITSLFENNNNDIQREFTQVCTQLKLELNQGQKVVFSLKETVNYIKQKIVEFHCELLIDIDKIFQKFSDFENLVDSQIKTISQLLTSHRLKQEQEIKHKNGLKPLQDCASSPVQYDLQNELQDQTFIFNDGKNFQNVCVFCKRPNAGDKCTECDNYFHFVCAKKEVNKVIIDEQEHKITCLKHVDKFYLRKVKMELAGYDIDQLENKSIDFEEEGQSYQDQDNSQQQNFRDIEVNAHQDEQFYEEEQNELYSEPDRTVRQYHPEQFFQNPQEIPHQISFYKVSNHSMRWRRIGSRSQSRVSHRSNQGRGRGRRGRGRGLKIRRGTGRPRGRPRGSSSKKMVLEDDDD